MELRQALTQVAEIRQQMARTEIFRGYRALPVAFSGALAWAAAISQAIWIPDPKADLSTYLALWIGAAGLSVVAAGVGMYLRAKLSASTLARELTWLAIEQFVPCLVAGGVITYVLALSGEECLWILPGLWSILFSLGIFASHRLLPRAIILVAIHYFLAGLICLMLSRTGAPLSPWAMGIPFGCGQFLAAAVLYGTLERSHGQSTRDESSR